VKLLSNIARWIFVLCLPPLLLSASIGLAFNSLWLYRYSLQKDNAGLVTGLSQAELDKAARGLISYFNSGEELINVIVEKDGAPFPVFNERDVAHLKDVKGLVRLNYTILFVTLFYTLLYVGITLRKRQNRQSLALTTMVGSGITLFLMIAFGVGIFFDFDQLLLQFHLISFSNDFWQLESGDYLLLFFPGFEAALFVALTTAAAAVIIGVVSILYLRHNKKDVAASG
jgi:integral membrane protein (TIGR01906 family)